MTPATAPSHPSTTASLAASVDAREIAKFSALAGSHQAPARAENVAISRVSTEAVGGASVEG